MNRMFGRRFSAACEEAARTRAAASHLGKGFMGIGQVI
jgi:hypothetical protein